MTTNKHLAANILTTIANLEESLQDSFSYKLKCFFGTRPSVGGSTISFTERGDYLSLDEVRSALVELVGLFGLPEGYTLVITEEETHVNSNAGGESDSEEPIAYG